MKGRRGPQPEPPKGRWLADYSVLLNERSKPVVKAVLRHYGDVLQKDGQWDREQLWLLNIMLEMLYIMEWGEMSPHRWIAEQEARSK